MADAEHAELGIKDVMLMVLSVVTSLTVVIIFVVVGWYIVWVAFLSRFKLMRELLSVSDEDIPKDTKTKSSESSPSLSTTRTRRKHIATQRT